MKKFNLFAVLAVVLTIFSACQKDELVEEQIQTVASVGELSDVYSEDGYLVFKNYQVADSVARAMNTKNMKDQISWEKSLSFTSARSYRSKLNEEVLKLETYSEFEEKVKEIISVGYFNEETSCMDYPFSKGIWASILSKDGVVKIDDVLYFFEGDNGLAIHKGTNNLLEIAKRGGELPESVNYSYLSKSLKSVTLSDYGNYFNQRKWNGKYVLDVDLHYDVIMVKKWVYDPAVGHHKDVSLPDAVKYDLYCHQRIKRWYGWFDANTHLFYKDFAVKIGGNYVSEKGFYYGITDYTNSSPAVTESSNDLSNHYINLYNVRYPFTLDLVEQPAPSVSPKITLIDFDIWTGKVGSENDHIDMVIN